MLRHVFLVTLLVYSVCAVHWEMHEVDSSEDLDEIPVDSMTKQQLPGICWACKWVVKKVKKSISTTSTPDAIKSKLLGVCNQIGFLKGLCKKFVNKYLSTLIEEISTTDDPNTVCTNLRVCKSKPPPTKEFILSYDSTFDNL